MWDKFFIVLAIWAGCLTIIVLMSLLADLVKSDVEGATIGTVAAVFATSLSTLTTILVLINSKKD